MVIRDWLLSAAVVSLTVFTTVACQTAPTPVEDLVTERTGRAAMSIPERAAETEGSPSVLVLGSVHLAGGSYNYAEEAFRQVRETLSEYEPDMVVVEQLPPDWPVGKGRDYRPGFDLDQYAESWEMGQNVATDLVRRHRRDPFSTGNRCELAPAYFLTRDLANAAYHWLSAEHSGRSCPKPKEINAISSWLGEHAQSEYARFGYRTADRNQVPEVVSYDYQGADAKWFIGPARFLRDLVPFSDVSESNEEVDLHLEQHLDDLVSMLRFANSPKWMGLQYWLYEERHLDVQRNEMGLRQLDNFWLRNKEMFRNMQQAIETHAPQRVMVVTGMGHKYFIDTLVIEAGYPWIDPRDYLPAP